MTAHIRKRKYKSGIRYQVVLDKGNDSNGKRRREYISCDSYAEAQAIKAEKLHQYNMGSFHIFVQYLMVFFPSQIFSLLFQLFSVLTDNLKFHIILQIIMVYFLCECAVSAHILKDTL